MEADNIFLPVIYFCNVFLLHFLIYDSELTIHVVGVRADIVEVQWFLFNNALQSVCI